MNFLFKRVVGLEAFSFERMQESKALIIAVKCISRGKKEKRGKRKKGKKEKRGKKKKGEKEGKCILPQFGRSGL